MRERFGMEASKHIKLSLGREPGEFHLTLDGVDITINFQGALGVPPPGKAAERPGAAPPPPSPATVAAVRREAPDMHQLSAELDLQRQISLDIYEGLGRLAKNINLSIQDLSLAEIIQTGMSSPGERLDQARNQVTDVLLMTEQATLNIMDLVEQIREDCQAVQSRLHDLAESAASAAPEGLPGEAAPAESDRQSLWSQVLTQADNLDMLLGSPGAGETPGATPAPGVPLATILQLLLEFCGNETVKQHLKAVQAKQDVIFRRDEVEAALSHLIADLSPEEGFYQVPVLPVLELLKSHCDDDRVKELLAKMSNSAGKLFPVAALPLEAQEVAAKSDVSPSRFEDNPEAAASWQKLRHYLGLLEAREPSPASLSHRGDNVDKVKEVLETVERITGNLSRIIEALSFQDLSGQRLLKLLKLLRQLQVQVLTLLVGAGHKLHLSLDKQALSLKEMDTAREELDRLLQSFSPPSDQNPAPNAEAQPLDQNAVNELLTSMGF